MAAGEFDLIERHLRGLGAERGDVVLGPGDDAALLDPRGRSLTVAVASTGASGDPRQAAIAVVDDALNALRVTGAEPAWATLALSLASADESWLARFASALGDRCRNMGVAVAGGDTTGGGPAATLFVTGLKSQGTRG
jgi:thiamine-monophosphate kinase